MLDSQSPFAPSAPPGPGPRNGVALLRLRQAVVSCEIPPGAYIGEAEIARRFGLGRASVRNAFCALAAAGLVLRHPRQGWQSSPLTGTSIAEIVAARRKLEPALTDRALPERDHSFLQSLARVSASAIAAGDRQALSTARIADRQIMEALASGGGSLLRRWLGEVFDHTARLAHVVDRVSGLLWPIDREPLIAALAAGDRTTALAEIERDIAHFEMCALRALTSDALMASQTGQRSARRRKPAASRDAAPHLTTSVKVIP